MHEKYYGLISEELLASALERPVMAFQYENADLLRQAAHLLWGIIKNHPFRCLDNGVHLIAPAFAFLVRNDIDIVADQEEVIELGLGVAESRLDVDQVDKWLRDHAQYQTPN